MSVRSFLGRFFRVGTSALVVSCANPTAEKPRQQDAEDLVWRRCFSIEGVRPPTVEWHEGVILYEGEKFDGLFFGSTWVAIVNWTGTFSTSVYAHELMHAKQSLEGVYDYDHKLPEWGTLPEINAQLRAEGL